MDNKCLCSLHLYYLYTCPVHPCVLHPPSHPVTMTERFNNDDRMQKSNKQNTYLSLEFYKKNPAPYFKNYYP